MPRRPESARNSGDLVSASGSFDIHLQVQAADWVPVAELQLLANGESIETLPLAEAGQLDPDQPALRLDTTVSVNPSLDTWYAALATGDQKETARICNALVAQICAGPEIPPARVRVLKKRPNNAREELHGEYERTNSDSGHATTAQITVWMRTARKNQVVAFRTFLRTLLHELCHHLDYELLKLDDSFHTEGFFKRESSLFHQIVGDPDPA